MHMKHNGATRTLLQLIDGVFPIFDLYTVYIDAAATTKRPLLSPGAAHNHRAATERPPESADEIGSAARRGRRCGWRPSMMNEAVDVRHGCRCFPLVFVSRKGIGALRHPFIHFTPPPFRTKPEGADDNDIIFANMNVYPILRFTIHTMIDQYQY